MINDRTRLIIVNSQEVMEKFANMIIKESQWFEVEPLPDDEWEVTVSKENYNRFNKYLKTICEQ